MNNQSLILDKNGSPFNNGSSELKLSEQHQNIIVDYLRQNIGRYRRELNEWTFAREVRHDVDNPLTYALQEVYIDAMVDTHLTAITNNRGLRIQNLDFEIQKPDGSHDEELTKLLTEEAWFPEFMSQWTDSIFYGYSLIHVKDARKKTIKELEFIPREHVCPEKKWILNSPTDTHKGLPFNEFPNHLLYCQMYDAIGLLEKAAPMTILKRHSWASWDEFENKFGIPISLAYVPGGNTRMQQEVSKWLEQMGRSAAGVFPMGSKVELVENAKTDSYQVFLQKVSATNGELSTLVNGQRMTVENGSSRSQAEVHQKTEDEIKKADIKKSIMWLNSSLKPILIANGIPISEKNKIGLKKITDPKEAIKIDGVLMSNGYMPTQNYIERVYGVELQDLPKEEKAEKGKPPKKKS